MRHKTLMGSKRAADSFRQMRNRVAAFALLIEPARPWRRTPVGEANDSLYSHALAAAASDDARR
jgi:hypothetical protein